MISCNYNELLYKVYLLFLYTVFFILGCTKEPKLQTNKRHWSLILTLIKNNDILLK